MPGPVLSRRHALAGPQFPALHGSLQHFLTLALTPDTDKATLAAAAELDPAILATLLTVDRSAAADLARWHEFIEVPMFQAVGISMGNAATIRASHDSAEPEWRRALLRALVAGALATHLGAGIAESRITALLSDIGAWLDRSGQTDEASADLLAHIGCSQAVCDAVRYRNEPFDRLYGTSRLMRINAAAEQLSAYASGPDMIPMEMMVELRALTELTEDQLYDVIGRAARSFEAVLKQVDTSVSPHASDDAGCLSRLVESATNGAVFYRALVKSGEGKPFGDLVAQAGRVLFGFEAICHFGLDNGMLAFGNGDDAVRISSERPGSTVARCYRQRRLAIITEGDTGDVIERQLLHRFGTRHLLCLPLDEATGVLVCAVDTGFVEEHEHHKALLYAYGEACADLHRRTSSTETETIGLQYLQRRAREITHEVNNPLSIVQNYLGTLSLKLGQDALVQKEVDAISRELKRVGSIVGKFARIGEPEGLVLRRVSLNDMIGDLLGVVRGGRDDLVVETRFDASIPPMELPADALSQVLVNLFKNADEAMQGLPTAIIRVSTQGAVNVNGGHYIEIVVSDNGPGMSAAQRLALFGPEAGSTKGDGRGIGLGVVRRLLADMSAMIACRENPDGQGTSFQILLPLEQNNNQR